MPDSRQPSLLRRRTLSLAAALLAPACALAQTPATLTIDPADVLHPVSPMLYGMMTEEINHAFDGGLYPELVNNRTFHTTWEGLQHWDLVRNGNSTATLTSDTSTGPSKALSSSARLTVTNASAGNEAGLSNTGFWGIGVTPGEPLKGSFYAKASDAGIGALTVRIVNDRTGAVVASTDVPLKSGDWQPYTFSMQVSGKAATGAEIPSGMQHTVCCHKF